MAPFIEAPPIPGLGTGGKGIVGILLEVTLQQAFLVLTSFISLASAQKHESSLIPLFVLSESNPLALGFDSVADYLKYLLSRPANALPCLASSRAIS